MKACGLFAQQQQLNDEEDAEMDGCPVYPQDSANTDEIKQFMIMPRLGQNLEQYFESMDYKLP